MKSNHIDRTCDLTQKVEILNENEQLKHRSNFLRGTIATNLENHLTGSLSVNDTLLTKFHGIYQQDNRDTRQARIIRKLEPDYQFMVRLRIPGGVLTVDQWNEIDHLSRRYSSSGIRITTRQTIQLHGINKGQLKALLKRLRLINIDTIAACGDDSRGVISGTNPAKPKIESQILKLAKKTSERLIPRTSAYKEIWYDEIINHKKMEEPLYGKLYLPRKFKVGFAIPPYNDIDVFAQDIGFIAITDEDRLLGFNVCVGGGLGQLDTREDSYPRLATEIGFIDHYDAPFIAEVIMGIQRDFGDRIDRHRARFKYTIDRLGLDTFKTLLLRRFGKELEPARPYNFKHNSDIYGWTQTPSQKWQVTLHIQSGRVDGSLRDQLLAFFQQFSGRVRLTTNQNLQLQNIDDHERIEIERRLNDLGLEQNIIPNLQGAHTISCVALPTCGLAMAEAERYLPRFLELFDALKNEVGVESIPINLRITGCPNGCARPYVGEIALTGRASGLYNLYLGGSHRGDRLANLYRSNLNEKQILENLKPLLEHFVIDRLIDEHFGDFIFRKKLIENNNKFKTSHTYQEQ